MNMSGKKTLKVVGWAVALFLLVIAVAWFVYTGSWSKADAPALEALNSTDLVQVTHESSVYTFLPGKNAPSITPDTVGYVFYPGGKVETSAYAPMAAALAGKGIPVFIPDMPFHLAFLDTGAAGRVIALHPEVKRWAVGGHSLGGVASSLYAAKHPDQVKAIVFLASYPSQDMHASSLAMLSLKGSLDGLVSDKVFQEKKSLLPPNAVFQVLEGGNHAQFGSYGLQKGDQPATVKPEEQWAWTVSQTVDFLGNLK